MPVTTARLIRRRSLCAAIAFVAIALTTFAYGAERAGRPNVIVILTDDQGYADVGFHGCQDTYAAMLSAVDDAVGRISDKLRAEGLEEETLIFYLSDNGGHPMANAARNDPLRKQKGTVYEGRIRVPFVVKWTGRIPAGTKYVQPVISLDIAATALAAAGITPGEDAKLDGVDLVPHLRGDKPEPPHETLYWRFVNQRAIRQGKWKLITPGDEPEGLYDLSTDISESNDLSAAQPEVVRTLRQLYARWNDELPPTRAQARQK